MDILHQVKDKLEEMKSKYNQEHDDENNPNHSDGFGMYWSGVFACLKEISFFVDHLEMKEVDFEGTKSVFEGQCLSKDKVVTTIERLQDECEEKGDNNGVELLEKLFNKLDTLEVKDVDLEKEIDRWQGCEAFPEGVGITPLPKAMEIVERTAKHFFELGLKAQKGK